MDRIIAYLTEKYHPIGLIVYGSFADGTNNLNSDFDALLVLPDGEEGHDHSQIFGTELDVFIYPRSKVALDCEIDQFVQIWDGRIVIDHEGLLAALKEKVNRYIDQYAAKSRAENEHSLVWCEKMLNRTIRDDLEGLYRLHWLLKDSLEIYFDLKGQYYFGPKKALRQMRAEDSECAEIYYRALRNPSYENVQKWLGCLRKQLT